MCVCVYIYTIYVCVPLCSIKSIFWGTIQSVVLVLIIRCCPMAKNNVGVCVYECKRVMLCTCGEQEG